jgi:hypothetical protein
MNRLVLSAFTAVASMLVVLPALAEPTPSELVLARRLFAEASALEEAGNWAAASAKLREAIAIKETPGLRYHLAHCEEQSGALVEASLEYARASELIRAGAQAPDVAQLLALADQRLVTQIPKLLLDVPADIQGVTVEIDGHAVSSAVLKNPIPLDPGKHRIVARAPNRGDFNEQVDLTVGQTHTLVLVFPQRGRTPPVVAPTTGARPSTTPSRERRGVAPRTIALIGEGALAAAGLGVGIGFTVARANAADRVRTWQSAVDAGADGTNGGCNNVAASPECTALRRAIDEHRRSSLLMTVGYVGAGVGLTAGVLTWLLWPRADTHVSVAVGPDGGLLRARTTF